MPSAKRKPRSLPRYIPAEKSNLTNLRPGKDPSIIIGPVRNLLVKRAAEDDRRADVIHPSEMAKKNWCGRATYYRLAGFPPDEEVVNTNSELIFEEGHSIHHKWQFWHWQLGDLQGVYECIVCKWKGWATSPRHCPRCFMPAYNYEGPLFMRYREVPLESPEYRIAGHADGLTDELFEVKSMSPGTVRVEAPQIYRRYEEGELTMPQLWQNMRRPFPSHIRQGMIYCWLRGTSTMRFIYEWKMTSAPKEFQVELDEQVMEKLLDKCLDILYAVEHEKRPRRPQWATGPKNATCRECPHKTECWKGHDEEETTVSVRRRRRTS